MIWQAHPYGSLHGNINDSCSSRSHAAAEELRPKERCNTWSPLENSFMKARSSMSHPLRVSHCRQQGVVGANRGLNDSHEVGGLFELLFCFQGGIYHKNSTTHVHWVVARRKCRQCYAYALIKLVTRRIISNKPQRFPSVYLEHGEKYKVIARHWTSSEHHPALLKQVHTTRAEGELWALVHNQRSNFFASKQDEDNIGN